MKVADIDYWPQSVLDWLVSLDWDEVDTVDYDRDILYDGVDEHGHKKFSPGPRITVTVQRGTQTRQRQFNVADWTPVEEAK